MLPISGASSPVPAPSPAADARANSAPGTPLGGKEIESIADFDLAVQSGSLTGCRVQAVDLTTRAQALASVVTRGAVFLGCAMLPETAAHVQTAGALVFPRVPGLPFDPYRARLYSAEELFDGLDRPAGYEGTPDAAAYTWFQRTKSDGDILSSMLRAIHDDALSDALDELLAGKRVVGVMGGHALRRGTVEYADAARLGRELARCGAVVATGGGPGAMEAAQLGAYAAPHTDEMLSLALDVLAKEPSFTPSVTAWARAAFEVRAQWPRGGMSVSVPTWFYGHEPPNSFASHIAKYFANATREDGLLARSNGGVVFLAGAAGTVQEIFDNATPNYYESRGVPTPMVLVGTEHWTERLPAWPLLQALAQGRSLGDRIALVDRVDQAAAALQRISE